MVVEQGQLRVGGLFGMKTYPLSEVSSFRQDVKDDVPLGVVLGFRDGRSLRLRWGTIPGYERVMQGLQMAGIAFAPGGQQ